MMKKLLLGITMLCLWNTVAQVESATNDTIFTLSGALIEAQVTKVTENTIHYNYPNEQLVNEIGVDTIIKIVFANGRIQHFATPETSIADVDLDIERPEIGQLEHTSFFKENALSILPFHYIRDGHYDNEASEVATDYAYEFIIAGLNEDELMVEETIVTAKKLDEHEINIDQLHTTEIDILRKAVKTEYILKITIEECVSPESSHNNKGTGVVIHLQLFDAENEIEIYEASVSENLSIKTILNTPLVAEREWKPSLEFLLQHFLTFSEG